MATAQSTLAKVSPVRFFREATTELKKVSWPTRETTIKLTLVVIFVSLIIGLFVGGLDIVFLNLSRILFK